MKTDNAAKLARKCYISSKKCFPQDMEYICPGDSGDVKCFFCPGCVLSLAERIMNLAEYDVIAMELKK